MPRLFVGTFLSDEGVEKLVRLSQANESLSESWKTKIRWVDRSKFHITWVFLGEIESEKIPEIIRELNTAIADPIVQKPLTINYDKFELWPSERKARLAVTTTSEISKDVLNLDATIKQALNKFLIEEQSQHELKVFKPHLTILRFPRDYKPNPRLKTRAADIEFNKDFFPLKQEINEIALIESELGKHVDGYRKLAIFSLQKTV
jgi:RNA 2',3'-cyclic 3'-phosphodiesterase